MVQNQMPRTGGQILVDQLVIQGVERITCVPGESYLAALDALLDADIDVTLDAVQGHFRHQGAVVGIAVG